jgi:hypothetical protein
MTNIIPISGKAPQLSQGSATSAMIDQCRQALAPIGQKAGYAELMSCLTLVAPSGLTAADRHEWSRVAALTLTGIPADLMKRGCMVARETCRFPSEIVPAIIGTVKGTWDRRKRALADAEHQTGSPQLARPDYVSLDDARAIMAQAFIRAG